MRPIITILTIASMVCSCAPTKNYKIRAAKRAEREYNSSIIEPNHIPVESEITEFVDSTIRMPDNIYQIDPNKSLDIEIASYGYTRFSIENERITDVFIFPQESVSLQIHKQGYLILAPRNIGDEADTDADAEPHSDNDKKIYVTISGEEGTTQDFSLELTGKDPEPVQFVKMIWNNFKESVDLIV